MCWWRRMEKTQVRNEEVLLVEKKERNILQNQKAE
jgi:hypothetical protein